MTPTDAVAADRTRLVQLSMRFAKATFDHVAASAAQVGLPKHQAYALHLLAHQSALSMSTLGEQLGADPSTVTGLVDRLVARGLVQRHLDEHDRRVRTLTVTDHGREVDERVDSLIAASALGNDSLTDDDRRTLIGLLEQVLGNRAEPCTRPTRSACAPIRPK